MAALRPQQQTTMSVQFCTTPAAAFNLCSRSAPCSATAHTTLLMYTKFTGERKTNITLYVAVGVKSKGHAGGLGLFLFRGGRIVDAMCGGQQWSLDCDAVDYLTYL